MLLLQTDMTDPTQLVSRLAQQRSEKPYAYLQLASSNSKWTAIWFNGQTCDVFIQILMFVM